MSREEARWRIALARRDEQDYASILAYTQQIFGARQATLYDDVLFNALSALLDGPNVPGSVAREDILPGIRTLHVARGGAHARHFILYRANPPQTIEVLRILHDAMDLAQHL